MSNSNTMLSPQEILSNVLSVTLGASPSVKVCPPYESMPNYYNIDIIVSSIEMAINLSIVTMSQFTLDNSNVSINFYVEDCDDAIFFRDQTQWDSLGSLVDLFNSAFRDNPYYQYSAAPTDSTQHDEDLYVVFSPNVLQFDCNNKTNLYGKCSYVGADLFRRVIYNNFFGLVSVGFSTSISS